MKPARAQWSVLLALTVFVVGLTWGLFAQRAPAMTISNPGNTSIGGVSPCAGPLVSGEPLVYNGSTVCTGPANNTAINLTDASSTAQNAFLVDSSSNLVVATGLTSLTLGNNKPLRLGSNGISFQYDGDLSLTHAPRTPLTLVSNLATTTGTFGANVQYTPTVAMHIRGWDLGVATALTSCSPFPTFQLKVGGAAQSASAITLTSATAYHVGSLAIAVAAGSAVAVATTTPGASCSGTPLANAVIEMTTD